LLQRHAVKEFHGDEDSAIGITNVVDRADIGVVQGRGSTRLALEALSQVPIVRIIFRQEFQGNETTKASVLCLVNDTHASRPQLSQDVIMRDDVTNHLGERCGVPCMVSKGTIASQPYR